MSPPDGKHYALREKLREQAKLANYFVCVTPADVNTLLDYITELEEADYESWERSLGENL